MVTQNLLNQPPEAAVDVVFTRTFAAPRSLVYEVWTSPAHAVHWWQPGGFEPTIIEAMDVRPQGKFRFRMLHESGVEYLCHGTYLEVVPDTRLTYHELCDENGVRFHDAQLAISFEETAGQTTVTIRARMEMLPGRPDPWTPQAMSEGWTHGWKANAALLDDYLQSRVPAVAAAEPPQTGGMHSEIFGREVVFTRFFKAPRPLVYEAWTNPVHMARWWGPNGFTIPECRSDLRPGGDFRIVMRSPDGVDYPVKGMYLHVAPNECVVMTDDAAEHPEEWQELLNKHRETEGAPPLKLVWSAAFADCDGGTRLTLTSRFASIADRDATLMMGMTEGWSESLDRLEAALQSL